MKKLILCCLFGLAAIVCQADDVVEINSLSDLQAFRDAVNAGTNYAGQTVSLNCDLNVGSWTPIGLVDDDTQTFKGTFEGNGHTVIINVETASAVAGFFGYLRGTVQDLKVAGQVLCTNAYTSAAGGIAGYNHGTISECANLATIIGYICGGITGENAEGGTISNCYNTGYIGSNGSATLLAGIAGNNGGTIDHVYASCIVEAVGTYKAITASGSATNAFYNVKTHTGVTLDGFETLIGTALQSRLNAPGVYTIWQFTDGLPELTNMFSNPVCLIDDADNTPFLDTYRLQTRKVQLTGRTLYKDGAWNTLCLPFNMTAEQVSAQLDPSALMTLSSSSFSNGELTLNFTDATTIEAGKPYIIKWASGANIENPEFSGVTISSAMSNAETLYADFIGIYSPIVWDTENNSILFLGEANTLYFPQPLGDTKPYLNACRAYFQLNNGLIASEVSHARLTFDDGETTGILSTTKVQLDGPEGKVNFTNYTNSAGAAWYGLDGRRLEGKPTKKGLYIYKGKKVRK